MDWKVLREYAGVYQWQPNGFVYLQLWNELSGFDKPSQLVAFDESGEVRVLYPTERDHFFAGLRTHRSAIANLDRVCRASKENGEIVLLLCDGARIPVSRRRRARVTRVLRRSIDHGSKESSPKDKRATIFTGVDLKFSPLGAAYAKRWRTRECGG